MLFFGIIAVILIFAPDLVYKYTNHEGWGNKHWMWSEDDGEPSKIILWIIRIAGVVMLIIGLYYELT